VFALVTSSRPRFTIPEIVPDVHRAVRFIRTNAAEYNVDPDKLGIYGISAGAHLSLMVGLTGGDGDPEAEDPIDRISSAVQSVGEFCGPTDFLNYGDPGSSALGEGILAEHRAPFDFHDYDSEARAYVSVTPQRYLEIGRDISPITHATAAAPPVLAIHGTVDELVPLQQSQSLIDKLKGLGACAELIEVPEAGHGWQEMGPQMEQLAQWFNRTLSARPTP
jgi:acetyl esterase/lipase